MATGASSADLPSNDSAIAEMHGNTNVDAGVGEDTVALPTILNFESSVTEAQREADEAAAAAAQKEEELKKNKRFIAKEDYENGNLILLHLDLETGGTKVGIIQISAVAHDTATNKGFGNSFNEYVKPFSHIKTRDWAPAAMEVTGLGPHDNRIKNADSLFDVWPRFKEWCEEMVPEGKKGCITAWNGKASDLQYLFHCSEIQYPEKCKMPDRCPYYMDPYLLIPILRCETVRTGSIYW